MPLNPAIPLNPGNPEPPDGQRTLLNLLAAKQAGQNYRVGQMKIDAVQDEQAKAAQADQQFSALLQSGEAFKNPEAVFQVAGPERAKAFYQGL